MPADDASSDESVTHSSGDISSPPDLRIFHYNDVYHVDASSAEPVGGIARFQTLNNYYRNDEKFKGQPELLTFFSGDAFNPSLESSVTKGSHMVPVLNGIGTDCACVGNHDLDFGVPQFRHLARQCTFPWLLANVVDSDLGDDVPIGNAQKTTILTASNGIKIGLIGLVEREWLDTINSLPPHIVYKSVSATAKELVPGLREQGADFVIALSHQREPNDNKLAEKIPEGLIDIVLGGHDHYYKHSIINSTHVLRSGSDFKQLSYIEARRRKDDSKRWDFHILRRDVMSHIEQDAPTVALVEKLTASLRSKLEKPIGYSAAPLDARFTTVRLKESNMGNFVCDLMRIHYGADCCIMAAGTIRGDQIYPPGVIKLKDIMNCFPFEDPCVVVKVNGKAILDALENSVSTYPALEGRFPQVSNITFSFDPSKPVGSRVTSVFVGDEPLDHDKGYKLATRDYMTRGKDGYSSLLARSAGGHAEELVSEEEGLLISMILRQYFMSLKVLNKWKMWGPSMGRHWGSVHGELHNVHPTRDTQPPSHKTVEAFRQAVNFKRVDWSKDSGEMSDVDTDSSEAEESEGRVKAAATKVGTRDKELVIMRKVMRKWRRLAGLKGTPALCDELGEGEFMASWTKAIAPRLEGRIKVEGQKA